MNSMWSVWLHLSQPMTKLFGFKVKCSSLIYSEIIACSVNSGTSALCVVVVAVLRGFLARWFQMELQDFVRHCIIETIHRLAKAINQIAKKWELSNNLLCMNRIVLKQSILLNEHIQQSPQNLHANNFVHISSQLISSHCNAMRKIILFSHKVLLEGVEREKININPTACRHI